MKKSQPDLEPTKVIPFDEPIKVNGTVYTEMMLSEPRGKIVLDAERHLAKASISPVDLRMYQFTLVSGASGIPFNVVRDELPISKINEAATYLQGFIEAGTETGESA